MIYIIPIDRSTIRKNPNAGNTIYTIPIGTQECTRTEYYGDRVKEYAVYSASEVLILDRPRQEGDLQSGTISCKYLQPTQVVHTLTPEPAYFYKYENPTIECEYCKSQFKHIELKSEWFDDGDYGSHYMKNICPVCHEKDCCEIEFEKLDNHPAQRYTIENQTKDTNQES